MRRATITIPDDVEAGLAVYMESQDAPPTLAALVQSALRAYLTERGYLQEPRTLRLTPSATGSGRSDVSAEHDRELAGG